MANVLQCRAGFFPFKYLGLYVGANMNLIKNWKPIVDLFKNRLSMWKARKLSYGGRITLLKSVLSSLPTYFFSLYKAPSLVLNDLERLRRVFFWGGSEVESKMSWMAWHKVVAPVEYGGLGFGTLRDANLAMLAKWWWRFKIEKNGIWRKVIWDIHRSSRSWSYIPAKISIAGPWKQIFNIYSHLANLGVDLIKAIKGEVHARAEVSFWLDVWASAEPLAVLFPNLFQLEQQKRCCVAARVGAGVNGSGGNWMWKRSVSSLEELLELQQLNALLQGVVLSSSADRWIWELDSSGCFSVRSIKKILQVANREIPNYVVEWNNWIPKKVGVVAWRAEKERLPTREALSKLGISVLRKECLFCGEYDETCDHIFVSCGFAQAVWQIVYQWCKHPAFIAFSLRDILEQHRYIKSTNKKRKAFHAISLTTIWSIWRTRNEMVYSGRPASIAKVIEEVKTMSFNWIKYRSKSSVTWEQWGRFDVT
ncbi:putative reverse transcriptase zinc-binding domain-containing protein [Helianthus annuus]|nr:putative reverse transcriptase zinc-binding domain-containing protein [Helianthus annuus]KAJ0841401.1 putative reverse transcriptase zinc-binding domain-containing protein [Helianthus annuus]